MNKVINSLNYAFVQFKLSMHFNTELIEKNLPISSIFETAFTVKACLSQ